MCFKAGLLAAGCGYISTRTHGLMGNNISWCFKAEALLEYTLFYKEVFLPVLKLIWLFHDFCTEFFQILLARVSRFAYHCSVTPQGGHLNILYTGGGPSAIFQIHLKVSNKISGPEVSTKYF